MTHVFVVVLFLLQPSGGMIPAFEFTSWSNCEKAMKATITESMCRRVDLASTLAPTTSQRPLKHEQH